MSDVPKSPEQIALEVAESYGLRYNTVEDVAKVILAGHEKLQEPREEYFRDYVKAVLADKDAKIASLTADVKTWSGISDRNAMRLREAEAKVARLTVERDEMFSENGKLAIEIARLTAALAEEKIELADAERSIGDLKSLIIRLQDDGIAREAAACEEERVRADAILAEFMEDNHFCWKVLDAIRDRIRARSTP